MCTTISEQPTKFFCKKLNTYFHQSCPNSLRFVKKHEKKICKKFSGLGCCGKIETENDFSDICNDIHGATRTCSQSVRNKENTIFSGPN